MFDGSHISIDSTKLNSYEATKLKKPIVNNGTNPNFGMKRDTNGNNIRWFGWKLQILCDSKSVLPLVVLVIPASNYDDTVAISLIEQFFNNYKDAFKLTYYSMDSGYDFEYIYSDRINKFNGIPIIAYNPRKIYTSPEGLDDDFNPICSREYKLVYWCKDENYLKFRCSHSLGKCNCPFEMN
ncbi:transposase [Tissierella sp.]|uniref:transposase n=1 Tax=Tissierella sp. TaxID=41274 RepID=UPI0028A6FA8D|nr:transposase [Tissierella sp.]